MRTRILRCWCLTVLIFIDADECPRSRTMQVSKSCSLGFRNTYLALLMDPSSIVKRAVLHDISFLCIFLGRQRTNDVLLSHMITYLNDRDWLLRYALLREYRRCCRMCGRSKLGRIYSSSDGSGLFQVWVLFSGHDGMSH